MSSATELHSLGGVMQYEGWDRLLTDHFPPRAPDIEQRNWDAVRARLSVGQAVRGVVIARAAFGAWLDIGAGFPALLLVPDVADLTPERYQVGDWCPVGSTQDAEVALFNDPERKIRVSQGGSHESRA